MPPVFNCEFIYLVDPCWLYLFLWLDEISASGNILISVKWTSAMAIQTFPGMTKALLVAVSHWSLKKLQKGKAVLYPNHTVRDWTLQAKVNIDCCYSSLVTHVLHQKGLSTISNLNPIECYTPDIQWPEIWRPGCSQALRQPAPEMPKVLSRNLFASLCHQLHVGTQWKPAWVDEAFAKVSGFGRSIICMIEPPPRDGRMIIKWFLRDPICTHHATLEIKDRTEMVADRRIRKDQPKLSTNDRNSQKRFSWETSEVLRFKNHDR